MIRYTVVWDADIESSLANAWIAGDSKLRASLTAIADWIDKNLAEDPHIKGEPRPELSARMIDIPIFSSPARVVATYQVMPDDRLVRVIQLVFRST